MAGRKFLEGKIRSGKVYLSNTNRLIHYYQNCDGIKTGFTNESGHSISASAKGIACALSP